MRFRTILLTAVAVLALVTGCSHDKPMGEHSNSSGASDNRLGDYSIGTAPISESTAAVKACIEEQGLAVIYNGRGGLSSEELSIEQMELWGEVNGECQAEHGRNEPWTVDELKVLYQLEVKNHECLIDAGYESETPSSEQAFIDAWLNGTEPYQAISAVAGEKFLEATYFCPAPLWSFG